VQAYVQSAQNAAGAFSAVFKQCDASPACRKAYPDLARKFESVVRRAERAPFTVVLDGARPLTLNVDHVRLIEILFYAFYGWRDIADIPAAITALDAGDVQPLVKLATAALRFYEWKGASHGLFLAVTCSDEIPANPRQAVVAEAAREPLFEAFALSNPPLSACGMDTGPADSRAIAREPPATAIPTLMLAGELDPITPPRWAADLAAKLPKATLVRFGAVGHGVVSSHGCADRLIGAFLQDPSVPPFDPCQLALGPPDFSLPSGSQGSARRGNGPAR
jgi:pimeloyl-ACP methyl ester carboxylesterase